MSQSTPIEQLPPPRNSMDYHDPQMSSHEAMSMAQHDADRQSSQQQFVDRQFVETNQPQQVPMVDPRGMPPPVMHAPPQVQHVAREPMVVAPVSQNVGILTVIKNNLKTIGLVFFIILISQMAGVGSMVRKLLTYTPIPDNQLFLGGKMVISLVGAVVFVIAQSYVSVL